MKNTRNKVRLTESQLHRVIKESVKKVLGEMKFDKYAILARERAKQGRDQEYLNGIDDMTNKALKRDYPSSDGKFPSIRTYAKNPFSDSISQHGEYSDGVHYDPFDYWPFNPSNGDMPSPDAQFHHDLEDGTKWDIRNGEHNGRKGIRIGDKNPGIDALSRYFGKK